jgi:hypothetical protein
MLRGSFNFVADGLGWLLLVFWDGAFCCWCSGMHFAALGWLLLSGMVDFGSLGWLVVVQCWLGYLC